MPATRGTRKDGQTGVLMVSSRARADGDRTPPYTRMGGGGHGTVTLRTGLVSRRVPATRAPSHTVYRRTERGNLPAPI